MKYSVSGTFESNGKERSFEQVIEAPSENAAKAKVVAHFGSHNRTKSQKVKITKIEKG